MFDVIIIGAGVIGCAIARELSRYKLRILVLESSSEIAANGATKANTAIVHAGYDAHPGTNKAKFNVLGNQMFATVAQELDVPFVQNGSLVVAFQGDDLSVLAHLKKQGEQNGVRQLQLLDKADLFALEPNLNANALSALYAPTGGITSPYELAIAYGENAATNGVQFVFEKRVSSIQSMEGRFQIYMADGSQYGAKTIVNAAGMHADELNNELSKQKFTIHPRKGEYYMLDKTYANLFTHSMFQLPNAKGKGVLIAPTVEGTVLVGPTAQDIDEKEDTRTTKEGLAAVLAQASRTYPAIPKDAFITAFSGIRAHGDIDDFVIGEAGDAPGFFNAACIESPGLTAAPAIGMHIASLIGQKLNAKENTAFNPKRKAIPHFLKLSNAQRSALIGEDKAFGNIVCRCEMVSEAQIRMAIRRPVGATTVDGVKRRVRAGMGRCQGGFCLPKVIDILSKELHIPKTQVRKSEIGSTYLFRTLGDSAQEET